MTSKLTQWSEAHTAEHGAYAVLAGFEADLRAHNDVLATWYSEADLDEQLALFGWVTDLLTEQEAAEETMTSELNDLRERVMAQLRPVNLVEPPAAEPPITQALHRAVVALLTEARDAAQREAGALREVLERERARAHAQWVVIHEAAQHVGTHNLADALLPGKVEALVRERDAAREELEAIEAQMEHFARAMIYKGNSVQYWWAKAHAYKGIVGAVCEAFRALGYGGEFGDLDTLPDRLGAFTKSLLDQRRDLDAALDRAKRTVDAERARLRAVAQTLIAAVGAEGPCDAEAAAERIAARLALAEHEIAGLRERLGEAQTDRDPKAWQHEVCIDDPENPLGGRGMVACAVSDIGHADRGVLLEPEVPLVERRHMDAARALGTRLTAERDEAWKTVELRDGIIADHQATEAAIAALLDEGTRDMGIRLDGEYRRPLGQRVNLELQAEYQRGRDEGVASGRAAAIVEAVELVEGMAAPHLALSTARIAMDHVAEQLKKITPWVAP